MGKEQNRLSAEAAGKTRYQTEVVCKWGHTEYRYTKSGACCTCMADTHAGVKRDPNLDPVQVHKRYRRIAKSRGATRFMSPFPCPQGHTDGRGASDGKCVTCVADKHRAYMARPEVAEVQKARQEQWREDNREHVLAEKKRWYEDNKEHAMSLSKVWYQENKDLHRQYMRTCYKRRPEVYRANSKARAKRVKQATVPFSDMSAILKIYRFCPTGYEVGHIVPLKAINPDREHVASGLHVSKNLQYLTVSANSTKSNRWSGSGSFGSNAIVPFSWEHFLVISEQA